MVGAPRAATTALYHSLGQHPDVFVPPVKEPHFFSWPEVGDTYYRSPRRTGGAGRGAFVGDKTAYLDLYRSRGSGQLAGDFSTSYLFRPEAAERIHRRRPDARIVMVLRDPAERALSHHRMDLRDGYTDQPLRALIAPDAHDPRFRREYIDVGRYASQVERQLHTFGSDRVHIVWFDELTADPDATLGALHRFLGIESRTEERVLAVRNSTGSPRSTTAARVAPALARAVGPVAGPRFRRLGRALLFRSEPPPAEPGLREELVDLFRADVEALERLIDRDLTAWKR